MNILKNQLISLASILFIIVVGSVIYSNSLHNAFHFDDMFFILDKPNIRNLSDIKAIWHSHSHPARFIGFLSFALNYHFHQYQVWGYHVVNILIHLSNAVLVWWMVRLLFRTQSLKDSRYQQHVQIIALMSALVFVSHPLQTQAVTYITQRFASLATFFYLLSIATYIRGRLKLNSASYVLFTISAVSAVLGMFTKQIVFTLPLSIILIELMFINSKKIQWPAVISVFAFILIVPAIFKFNVPGIFSIQHFSESHEGDYLTTMVYFKTQMRVLLTYLRLLILPLGQNLDYDYPALHSFLNPQVFLSMFFLLVLLILAIRWAKKERLIAFGIFWFFITISVESTFIVIKNVMFEHRMYLPMAGLSILITMGVFRWVHNKKAAICILSLLILTYSGLTYQRNAVWSSGITMWTDVVAKSPNKSRPHISLAIAYIQEEQFDEALVHLNRALEINPSAYKAYNNLGLVYAQKNQFKKAVNEYDKALALKPKNPITHNNRGEAYRQSGQPQLAYNDYSEAIRLNPYYAQAYINRGVFYGKNKEYDLALADFTSAIKINPTLPESYNNRGIVYQQMKFFTLAQQDFDKALNLKPSYADAYYNRGNVFKDIGQLEKAMNDYNNALKIRNNYSQVYNNRGIILGSRGKHQEALENFSLAINYNPKYSAAYFNRSIVHMKEGAYNEALEDTLKAQKLGKMVDQLYIKRIQSLIK